MSQQNLARELRAQAYRLRKELNPGFTSVTDQPNLSNDDYATKMAEETKEMDSFMGQHIAQLLEMTTPTKTMDEGLSSLEEDREPSENSPLQARKLSKSPPDSVSSQLEQTRSNIRKQIQEIRKPSPAKLRFHNEQNEDTVEKENDQESIFHNSYRTVNSRQQSNLITRGESIPTNLKSGVSDMELLTTIEGMKEIEKNMDLFHTASLQDWLEFKQKYFTYKIKKGRKRMIELFDSIPLAIYARMFQVDIKTLMTYEDDALIAGIDSWHGVNRIKADY